MGLMQKMADMFEGAEDELPKGKVTREGSFDTSNETNTRMDVRKMAYAKMLMRELGMEQEDALELIDSQGLDKVMKMFQGKDPEKMEDSFETIKGSMNKYKDLIKELNSE